MKATSDAEVMAASAEKPEEFGAIFDRHAATLLRFLVRRVGPDVGEGLLGEIFRIAFESRARFDRSRASALPWLYGIASNLLLKQRRSEARRLRATARMLADNARAGSEEAELIGLVEARAQWSRVAERVASLPAGERDALLLLVWEELSYADIASALEVPVGTVRSRLSRARSRLRELDAPAGKEAVDEPTKEPSTNPGRVRG